ncbi:unnamed protein product [Lepidochelys kempii]
MLALGVIQPSASPWASPVLLFPKKDGSVWFCVDYRKLNAITVSDAYPMSRPDELLEKLGGAQYLTTMDLTKGYWQVPLDADARLKSAFITPLGVYEFLTLPPQGSAGHLPAPSGPAPEGDGKFCRGVY